MWVHTVSGVVLLWNDVLSEGIRLAWIRLVIVVYKPDDALTREQALVAIAKGDVININNASPYTSMPLNLNPLEYAFLHS